MNLNKVKNVELLRKGLYAQELSHYASLCNLYASLLQSVASNPDNITPADIEKASKKYGPLMDAASKSNFSFLKGKTQSQLLEDGTLKTPQYSESDVEFFKLYAYHSEKLMQFRTGSRLLEKVIDTDLQTGKKILSSGALDAFKNVMRQKTAMEEQDHEYSLFNFSDSYLRKEARRLNMSPDDLEAALIKQRSNLINSNSGKFIVDKLVPEHSPRWLGSFFFKKSDKAINLIDQIDPDHFPKSSTIIKKGLTPLHFGAEITGAKGNIERLLEPLRKKDEPKKNEEENEFDPFTKREKEFFANRPSEFHEKLYRAANNSRTKAILGVSLLTLLATGTVAAVAPHLLTTTQQITNFNNLINDARNQPIVTTYPPMTTTELQAVISNYLSIDYSDSIEEFREDTNAALDAIQATCQTYQKNYSTPTKEEAGVILDSLDNVTSKSIEQLVVYAIQEAYPNYTDIEVDFYYDYETEVDGTDLEKKVKKEGFKVYFTDENGNRMETEMDNISSPLFAENLGQAIMDLEKSYGTQFDEFFEAISNPNARKANGEKYTYEDISDLSTQYFNTISQKANQVRPMTVTKAKFVKGEGVQFDLEIEQNEPETPTTSSVESEYDGR